MQIPKLFRMLTCTIQSILKKNNHFTFHTKSLQNGVDSISYRIKQAIAIPEEHVAQFQDIPVTELATNHSEALRYFSLGMYELTVHDNYADANHLLEKAIEKIPPLPLRY